MEATNLPVFLNLEMQTKSLAKMAFNKPHLSICMLTRGRFITTKISLGEQPKGGGKEQGYKGGSSLPLFPLWHCPWHSLGSKYSASSKLSIYVAC